MQDVQNLQSDVDIPINRVGIRDLRLPILVRDRNQGEQHTVASVELGVDLPGSFKGTHMSRFVEALENWSEDEKLDYSSMNRLLEDILTRLNAEKAQAIFAFPYFLRKKAPVSPNSALQGYECRLTGELGRGGKTRFLMEVAVPVMTVCPCSKAISDEGAHSQRAEVRIAVRMKEFSWLEEFIEMAEASGSSPTYPLLKRADEKFVTEAAFANPAFVEDLVRSVALKLTEHPQVYWFRVEVKSFESIHAHNAFAWIEKEVPR